VPEKFLKPYDPGAVEDAIYKKWEESGFFDPNICVAKGMTAPDAEPFSIVLPPPNVTGTLHLGHAAMLAVEDTVVRFKRMQGYKTLWLPGTDSAALATQAKVEEILYKEEKKTRHDIGREELLKRIDIFVEESKTTILNQLRKMGASLDWSRYAYTMDEVRYKAVMEAFVRMYNAGLIYRGDRIVNWDPKMQTTVSDDEVERVEQQTPFYYLQYGPFVIGTVRPETKFGDKYVVMHPQDERYAHYTEGQNIALEWINGPVTAIVVKDDAVDMELGSGVMTITPAHSGVDFEIAQRHGLDIEQVIDERGILLPIAGEFAGQHIKKARQAIVEKLKAKNLLVKTDGEYANTIATNSRGGGIIEPQIKRQWFVAVNKEFEHKSGVKTLKQLMRESVESGAVVIVPQHFEKIYYHWVDNLRDWCISRQIWFGHRIPVWYRPKADQPGAGQETYVGVEAPEGEDWEQDPDTLDTWFSSGLWTFSTLGWPEKTTDLETYHPTALLETGYDIIFFWVARMILMSNFLLGEVPFRQVYLHGLVRDAQGRKMSKSLGNIIDPLDMSKKYGADAVRLALLVGAAPGNDLKLSEDKIRGYKNFANKVWNIARFVLSQDLPAGRQDSIGEIQPELQAEFDALAAVVGQELEQYHIHLAFEKLYQYVWHRFADEIIEESKSKPEYGATLYYILENSLKLLHPFMPFVTEEIWSSLPDTKNLLLVEPWPKK